jgi:ABC-2 type transport system ATP-binding protein
VRDLVADGVTIFLTTQYLEEADQLATRIALLDGGRLVAEGTPAELKGQVPGGHVRLLFGDPAEFDVAARALGNVVRDEEALALQVPGDGGVRALRAILDRLDDVGVEPRDLSVHTPDLDDVFLALTGHATSTPAAEVGDHTVKETVR